MPGVDARGMPARLRPDKALQPAPLSPFRGFMAAAGLGRSASCTAALHLAAAGKEAYRESETEREILL